MKNVILMLKNIFDTILMLKLFVKHMINVSIGRAKQKVQHTN